MPSWSTWMDRWRRCAISGSPSRAASAASALRCARTRRSTWLAVWRRAKSTSRASFRAVATRVRARTLDQERRPPFISAAVRGSSARRRATRPLPGGAGADPGAPGEPVGAGFPAAPAFLSVEDVEEGKEPVLARVEVGAEFGDLVTERIAGRLAAGVVEHGLPSEISGLRAQEPEVFGPVSGRVSTGSQCGDLAPHRSGRSPPAVLDSRHAFPRERLRPRR